MQSLDAFRGFIMVVLASDGLGFPKMANSVDASPLWQTLGRQFQHVSWTGCAFWDLIQPSFMFMVGVSMAYSNAARRAAGQSFARMFGHAVYRSILLVLLGIGLRSVRAPQTIFTFIDVLTQIGLGYTFLFLLWNRPRWVQGAAATAILVAYWLFFVLYPRPAAFPASSAATKESIAVQSQFAAHWSKRHNVAADFDAWFLNKFPRHRPFRVDHAGYATLNFIPSLATMIFGLMTGGLLRGARSPDQKFWIMLACGLMTLLVGWSIDFAGLCPSIKIIWTPSWALFSTGWVLVMLALFFGVVDCLRIRAWCFPLRVVGMNSIVMYVMASIMRPWWSSQLRIHFGADVFDFAGIHYALIVEKLAVLIVMWLVCLWLYRQRIFIRI